MTRLDDEQAMHESAPAVGSADAIPAPREISRKVWFQVGYLKDRTALGANMVIQSFMDLEAARARVEQLPLNWRATAKIHHYEQTCEEIPHG